MLNSWTNKPTHTKTTKNALEILMKAKVILQFSMYGKCIYSIDAKNRECVHCLLDALCANT